MEGAPDNVSMAVSNKSSLQLDRCLNFSWENLSYDIIQPKTKETKRLLHSVTGTAIGGRLLAIMGPSGAGKTTMINAITGRAQQDENHILEGACFVNNVVLSNQIKGIMAVVAQDDIVMGKETPRDAFNFSSRVRLGLDADAAVERTEQTLDALHLQRCSDTLIGLPGLIKGISGGEKKRTNIGSELITNPAIMLLDEPTTGLDSVNALRVGKLLKELANEHGRTVLCTIHSPSSELFMQFDDLLLLSQGHVIYHGPVLSSVQYFTVVGHPPPPRTNPSEFYMNLLQRSELIPGLAECWQRYATSPDAYLQNRSLTPVGPHIVTRDRDMENRAKERTAGWGVQLQMLTARAFRLARRDPSATMGRLIQTIFFALFLGLFYFGVQRTDIGVQDRAGSLFMIDQQHVFVLDERDCGVSTGARGVLDGTAYKRLQPMVVLPIQNVRRAAVSAPLSALFRVCGILHDWLCENRSTVLHSRVPARLDCKCWGRLWCVGRRVLPQGGECVRLHPHHVPPVDACGWFVREYVPAGSVLDLVELPGVSTVRLCWTVLERIHEPW